MSAGVALASPWAHGLKVVNCPKQRVAPPESRFIFRHLSGILKRGVVVGSIYCYTGIGDGEPNIDLLKKVCGVFRSIGRPFILGGDSQMYPAVLSAAGIPGMFKAKVFPPNCDTYVSGDAASEICYFLASNDLALFVESCTAKPLTCVANHSVVTISFNAIDKTKTINVVRRPKKLPLVKSIGCPPPPPDWDGFEDLVLEIKSQEDLDHVFHFVRSRIVGEILDGVQGGGAFTKEDYLRPFKVVQQSAYPPASEQPATNFAGNLWRYLHSRLEQWLLFRGRPGKHRSAKHLWIYLKAYKPCCLDALELDEWASSRHYVNILYRLTDYQVHSFSTWVDSFAFREEQLSAVRRLDSWTECLAEAKLEPGMPKIHKFLKGLIAWQVARVAWDRWRQRSTGRR